MISKDIIEGLKKGFESFGQNIALIVNTALLLIVYIFGVGITSIIAKITGKHFLDVKLDKNRRSYWEESDLKKKDVEEYYRQF